MSFVNVLDVAAAGGGEPADWTDVFKKAINAAVSDGHAGVLVPARAAPYEFTNPMSLNMSIDLRGKRNFVLMGEGPRSVLAMTGPGSWHLIHIGDGATDVVVRDLCLDGSNAEKVDPKDDQLHLVWIGASDPDGPPPHGARRISVIDCILRQSLSDGVAIVPASSTDRRDEVSDITISDCHFLGNRRSGVSNQRLGKRVSILHNRFEGTSDQDIDIEPSGALPDAGPSGYLILGNTMVRRAPSAVSVTLSGITPEARSRVNTFAYNQIIGGQLGVHDAQDLAIVGNYIEIGPGVQETVVRLGGAIERLLFADNSVVRPKNADMGTLMNLTSEPTDYALPAGDPQVIDVATDTFTHKGHRLQTGVGPLRASVTTGGTMPGGLIAGRDYWAIQVDPNQFQLAVSPQEAEALHAVDITSLGSKTLHLLRHGFPRTVDISRNRFSTFRPLSDENSLITITNASTVSFRDNDVASYAGATLPIALKFESKHDVHKRQVAGWDVVGNRFLGNAQLPPRFEDRPIGHFDICVSMSASHDTVGNVRVAENTFSGCRTHLLLHAEKKSDDGLLPAGAFVRAPHVTGNIGDGTLALEGVPAVLVGGNLARGEPAGARFCGPGKPSFSAPIGSLYSRMDGTAGKLLYINVDGGGGWAPIA